MSRRSSSAHTHPALTPPLSSAKGDSYAMAGLPRRPAIRENHRRRTAGGERGVPAAAFGVRRLVPPPSVTLSRADAEGPQGTFTVLASLASISSAASSSRTRLCSRQKMMITGIAIRKTRTP